MLDNLEIKSMLSSEERNRILNNLFEKFQQSPTRTVKIALTEYEKNFVKEFYENQKQSINSYLYTLTDQLLQILEYKETANLKLYEILMQLLQKQQSYIESNIVAKYLFYQCRYVTSPVVGCLMKYANLQSQPKEALNYFYNNLNKLSKDSLDILYIRVIESLLLQNKIEDALDLCQKKLKELFKITYDLQTQHFLKQETGQEITAEDTCWQENIELYSFSLKLGGILEKKHQNTSHSIPIFQLLRKINPEDPIVLIALTNSYRKNNNINKAIKLYNDYLIQYPDKTLVWTNYLVLLINNEQLERAQNISQKLIEELSKSQKNLKKIKILHAWFFATPAEGKSIFNSLIDEFKFHAMTTYVAIRYAIKIRDREWKENLIEQAKIKFANKDNDFIEIIKNLSAARMVYAVIENDYFSPRDLLTDHLNLITNYRDYNVPEIIIDAFHTFCNCAIKPCQSTCLDNVDLIGSAVPICMAWSDAQKKGEIFDIRDNLHDLDFIIQLNKMPDKYDLSGFERVPYILNLYTKKGTDNQPDIDVLFYVMDKGTEDNPSDISPIMKNRDLTINSLTMNVNGRVRDLIGGRSLADYDNNILNTIDEPLSCLSEDDLRPLRVISKLIEKQPPNRPSIRLHQDLIDALYKLSAPDWLKTEKVRKKFCAHLTSNNAVEFITELQYFSILGFDLDKSNLRGEELLLSCLTSVASFCREKKKLTELDYLYCRLSEKNETLLERIKLQLELEQLKSENINLKEEYQRIKQNIELANKEKDKAQSAIRKKVKNTIKLWEKEYIEEQDKKFKLAFADKENKRRSVEPMRSFFNKNNASRLDIYNSLSKHIDEIDILLKDEKNIETRYDNFCGLFTKNFNNSLKNLNLDSEFESIKLSTNNDFKSEILDWNWSITEVTEAFEKSYDLHFSAFLSLYLGYAYLYKNNNPLVAWYYLFITETRLRLIPNHPTIQNFLSNSLLPLIVEALDKSGLSRENINSYMQDAFQYYSSNNPEESINKIARIEFVISTETPSFLMCMSRFYNMKYLEKSDFINTIATYEYYLSANILSADQRKNIDLILSNFIQLSLHYKKSSSLAIYIKKLQVIQMFPNVKSGLEHIFNFKSKYNLQEIDLIKLSLENTPDNINSVYLQLGNMYEKNNDTIDNWKARDYYSEIINNCNNIKNSQLEFYNLWASQKMKILSKKISADELSYEHPFEKFLNLFENIILLAKRHQSQDKSELDQSSIIQAKMEIK